MKTVVALLFLSAVSVALADPYTIAIQQAQRVSNQNAAEQQRIQQAAGSASTAAPGMPNPPPANPALQATLQNISSLQADIIALNADADGQVVVDQKIALLNDLSTAAQGSKPSPDSVKALVKDLMTALTGKKIPAAQQTRLAQQLHATFNSSHLTDAQRAAIFAAVQKTLTDAGVSLDAATDVVTDLKKVADETK